MSRSGQENSGTFLLIQSQDCALGIRLMTPSGSIELKWSM